METGQLIWMNDDVLPQITHGFFTEILDFWEDDSKTIIHVKIEMDDFMQSELSTDELTLEFNSSKMKLC